LYNKNKKLIVKNNFYLLPVTAPDNYIFHPALLLASVDECEKSVACSRAKREMNTQLKDKGGGWWKEGGCGRRRRLKDNNSKNNNCSRQHKK